jgi:hypothetical protein
VRSRLGRRGSGLFCATLLEASVHLSSFGYAICLSNLFNLVPEVSSYTTNLCLTADLTGKISRNGGLYLEAWLCPGMFFTLIVHEESI